MRSTRMMDILSSMGYECYTTPTEKAFDGTIKGSAEDFTVAEIDADGCLVCMGTDVIPSLPLAVEGDDSATKRVTKARQRPSDVPPLSDLIGGELCTAANELAEHYRRTLNPEGCGSVALGVIGDKDRRTQVHVAVRLAQPVLKTGSSRNEMGDVVVMAIPDPNYIKLNEVLTSEESEKVLVYLHTAERTETYRLPPDTSKEHRTKVHLSLRELYGGLVESKTFTAGDHTPCRKKPRLLEAESACIELRFRSKPEKAAGIGGGSEFVKFVLYKKNIELLDAIKRLSDVLNCRPSQFAFAGIKDKKAITLQHVTLKGVSPDRLQSVRNNPHLSNIATSSYQYVGRHIMMGELRGNAFIVVVRDTCVAEDVISSVVEAVKSQGFVNYFGPQRFGCSSVSDKPGVAVHVGLAMLLGDHKRAVEVILQPQDSETSPANAAKQYLASSGDIAGTLKRMPSHKTREVLVLKALNRYGYTQAGCRSALMNIPYSVRKLYVHSVSSLIWNHLASFRIQQYGLRPVEGDLVIPAKEGVAGSKSTPDDVRVVTAEDVCSGCYSIGDVVLPIVGRTCVLPQNETASRLQGLLASLQLSQESFKLPALGMNFPGAYRKLLAVPSHMTCHMTTPGAVTLEFRLEPSCYATILLRELMKTKL